jgi:vancomycin resistance protein YoaR
MLKKNIVILSITFFTLFSFAGKAFGYESLGIFYNDQLQEIYSRPYTFTFENKLFPFPIEDFLKTESALVRKSNYQMEIENPYFCFEKQGIFSLCDFTETISQEKNLTQAAKIYLDKERTKNWLESISSKIDQEPKNGKIEMDEEKKKIEVFSQSTMGYKLNTEKSLENLESNLKNNLQENAIALDVEKIEPQVNTDNVDDFGIKQLIGSGTSNFAGSPKNRIFNINVALESFQGQLIKRGEEFSFTTILGEVDEEHGYKEELVIKNNETIPEFGGGVCQVSTTMFRAALNTGLKITERHNHAYPVSYYNPQGSDATIYVPKPDLRFVNDTPAYIFINTKVEGTRLTIEMYGTSDERQVELDGPHITEKTPDNKMKTILTQIIKDKDGEEIRRAVFKSFYDDPAKYHRDEMITVKPDNWSKKQWNDYKQQHGM